MFAKRKIILSRPDDDNPLSDYDKDGDKNNVKKIKKGGG